jgi:hypothetical protein
MQARPRLHPILSNISNMPAFRPRKITRLWAFVRQVLSVRGLLQWTGWWDQVIGLWRTLMTAIGTCALVIWGYVATLRGPEIVVLGLCSWAISLIIWGKLSPRTRNNNFHVQSVISDHRGIGGRFSKLLTRLRRPATRHREIRITSTIGVECHIRKHPSQDGLIAVLTNHNTANICRCRLWVREARSFDARKGGKPELRDDFGFQPNRIAAYQPILAGTVAKQVATGHESAWLIRVNGPRLEVGNTTNQGILQWPSTDSSPEQLWRLDVSFEVEGLDPWAFRIRVAYIAESGDFYLELEP